MHTIKQAFLEIWEKDRALLFFIFTQFVLGLAMFLTVIFNLKSDQPKVWARYSAINNGYLENDWWYMLAFAVLSLVFMLAHPLFTTIIYKKRGRDVARLFLGASAVITIIALSFLLNILGEQ